MSTIHPLAEAIIAFLIVLGGSFALIGSWGLARLPSLMTRLHGPTKATTLGVGSCLIASMIYFPATGGLWSAHELLITLFLFIAAPISANMIAKAHLHQQREEPDPAPAERRDAAIPSTGGATDWATFWPGATRPAPRPRPAEPPTEPPGQSDLAEP
ncbi:MAG TPA: Na+/H+ antiporter subunit G [Allosphingosinicella sp.]|nr:Na+/H+ antiporter subunit G [Allosphingosinicella sp.]